MNKKLEVNVVDLDQQAFSFFKKNDYKNAVEIYKKIEEIYPGFKDGCCCYNLARCLEELGEYEEAEKYFIKALEYEQYDSIKWGGYAEFLYAHRSSKQAFEVFLNLLAVERREGLFGIEDTIKRIKLIGQKMGLIEEEVMKRINSV